MKIKAKVINPRSDYYGASVMLDEAEWASEKWLVGVTMEGRELMLLRRSLKIL